MLKGFKQFILRGNILDLGVAVVMGVAFGAVVTALVKDLITPLIAAIIGKPDFSAIEFTVNGSKFPVGDLINALVSFILIAAVYFFIVLPTNTLLARMRRGSSPRSDHQEMSGMPQRFPLPLAVVPSALCRSPKRTAIAFRYYGFMRTAKQEHASTRDPPWEARA